MMDLDIPDAHQRFVVHVVAHLREQLPSAIQACAAAMPGVLTPWTRPGIQDAASAALTSLLYATHAGEGAAVQAAWVAHAGRPHPQRKEDA
jgi:hypothetical protein